MPKLTRFASGRMAGFMAASSHDKWSSTVDYSSMAFVCEKLAGCESSLTFFNLKVKTDGTSAIEKKSSQKGLARNKYETNDNGNNNLNNF